MFLSAARIQAKTIAARKPFLFFQSTMYTKVPCPLPSTSQLARPINMLEYLYQLFLSTLSS